MPDMQVRQWNYPDGTLSYEVLEATAAELAAWAASSDPVSWIPANATVAETVTGQAAPTPGPMQAAAATVASMTGTIPTYLTQAQADAAAIAAMTTTDLTGEPILGIHQRMVTGMATLLEGLQALMEATGQ